jgi:hypothetical protein
VARQLGASEDELAQWIAHADAFLRDRLTELGVAPNAPAGARRQHDTRPRPALQLVRRFDQVCLACSPA